MSSRQLDWNAEPSGFFVLRSPLLPFDEFQAWTEGLSAAAAERGDDALEAALRSDRARLRERLIRIFARPEIQEAIFLASPDLEKGLSLWQADPESDQGRRIELALVRYFVRMACRATPFGLFAGCTMGEVGAATELEIVGRPEYRRATRLDFDYLTLLSDRLRANPALREAFRYVPQSALYTAAGSVRYVEATQTPQGRSYRLVAAEASDPLLQTLDRAAGGASVDELAAPLVDDEITIDEAREFIVELIDSQLLIGQLGPLVTGDNAALAMANQLRGHAASKPVAERLHATVDALRDMDGQPIGQSPGRYRAIADELAALDVPFEIGRLFQVDMVKPGRRMSLGPDVVDEIARGVRLLHRSVNAFYTPEETLQTFQRRFRDRYEGAAVPLLEAIDDDAGIGLEPNLRTAELPLLLQGIAFPYEQRPRVTWVGLAAHLFRKVEDASHRNQEEIEVTLEELLPLTPEPPPMANAFAVNGRLAAAEGKVEVFVHTVMGPSGGRLLGRFCHTDDDLHESLRQHLRHEEALQPDAIFAEIVHLPEGRIGNVLARPVLRDFEITYLGESGAAPERQLPASDLLVSLDSSGQIILTSRRLGRRVIPRLTNAHNYSNRALPVYRFLSKLQSQGISEAQTWRWGPLANLQRLPRVRSGRVVLSPRTWNLFDAALGPLRGKRGVAAWRAASRLREEWNLPRFVEIVQGDNHLLVDLENIISIETFAAVIRREQTVTLMEPFISPDWLLLRGPEGRFTSEFVLPFIRRKETAAQPRSESAAGRANVRRFHPGSDWLFAKLYCGEATADAILTEIVGPVAASASRSGSADGWFFLRFGDPDHHVRVRFHGSPEGLHGRVAPALYAAARPFIDDGRIWRIALDTYTAEGERYGGDAAIALAESLFHADSEAVLALVAAYPGEQNEESRWRLALAGMHRLLDDFGYSFEEKRKLVAEAWAATPELKPVEMRKQLGMKFRAVRPSLEGLLALDDAAAPELSDGFAALRKRSERIRGLAAEMRRLEEARMLTRPLRNICRDFLHLHVNRLLRSSQQRQEIVLYDLLDRLYAAAAHR